MGWYLEYCNCLKCHAAAANDGVLLFAFVVASSRKICPGRIWAALSALQCTFEICVCVCVCSCVCVSTAAGVAALLLHCLHPVSLNACLPALLRCYCHARLMFVPPCPCMRKQCMHSQAVELTATKLVLEPATKLLFGASVERSKETECVSVHSLDVEVSQ